MNPLSSIYGAAASWRRRWYARDASRVKRLARPVVSVGNLRAGGSGKTPIVAHLARVLAAHGERPAILSRGYRRRKNTSGVTVVSDGRQILVGYDEAGDEPLMLARALPFVPVLVGADRFASGSFAERELGATVHVLDDGFQHVALARDADLLLVEESDLSERVLPVGLLREPVTNAAAADALLVTAPTQSDVDRIALAMQVPTAFRVVRRLGPALAVPGSLGRVEKAGAVFAFAGIARAERFFDDLSRDSWSVAGSLAFHDHHPYTQRDIDRVVAAALAAGASALLTTEKDAVRFEALDLSALPVASVSLTATLDPADAFITWLLSRVRSGGVAHS